jgi:tetratricopeptide (TPR) repeat protein
MHVIKPLVCIMLLLCALCSEAKDHSPDQRSIDSLLHEIDRINARNYAMAMHFIDSTLSDNMDKPALATQYLYVKMKKSSVLLRAKAYSKALQNLLEIEAVVNEHSDVRVKAFYQAMMAFIYGDQGNFHMAIGYYKKTLAFYQETGELRKSAITLNNLADSYLAIGDYENASREINKAMALYDEHQFFDPSVIYTTAGEIELSLKNYEKALFYFNHSLNASGSSKTSDAIINPERNLFMARAFIGLKDFAKAKEHFELCKSMISQNESTAFRYYLTLVEYFKATHKFDSALVYHEKALKLSERIDARQSMEAIEIVKLNERYEHENSLLREQIDAKIVQQKLYIVIVILSILSVSFLTYAVVMKRRDYKMLKIQNDEIAAQSEELRALTDELAAQGDALQRANEVLEEKVNERTTSLITKNAQLTQYAFFNAHSLRSPIATLLGLKQLLRMSTSPEEKDDIMNRIFTTAERFDEVVRESQKILNDFDGDEAL